MSAMLKILCRVIARRMEEGEELPHSFRIIQSLRRRKKPKSKMQ